ncbi:unnamed protein product [Peronospora destructor]|uniref:Beta-lactamase-related domain-containing protein n=1 Tax=Peronospora destructor TaxID=86335 RepID=A0AAV0UZG0_9STRA|nr:unnamed protein product [Peronospora destructor]
MPQANEELPLVNASLQQQLSSYHERQRARQQHHHRSRTVGRVVVGFLAASLLTLLLVALSWPAQHNERALELHTLLDAYQHAKNFSGVVRLSHNGQKQLQQAMGLANVPFEQPMKEHSVFPMGAHMQLLTAVALHQLQERGLVDLKRSVSEHWTEEDWLAFKLDKNRTTWCPTLETESECQVVTFEHLLYMGSGVGSKETDMLQTMGAYGVQIGTFLEKSLAFKPGTSYKYADENYVLLAYMVEKLSRLTMKEYLDQHIFQPLGLIRTTFDPFHGAVGVRHAQVDQYVQFYAQLNGSDNAGNSSSNSSSRSSDVVEKHLHHMSTGSCAIYEGRVNSLDGLLSTGKDMHKIYTDLFHEQGHHSKLLKANSIAQIVQTRNPAYSAFGQGIGVDFEEQPGEAVKTSNWPAKITFCGSTACSTTCMAMQMPAANMSIVASAFTNDVRLYFPSVDAFHAYNPRDFLETEKNAFEKNDGAVNTFAWSLLQIFLRFYTARDN